MYENILLGNAFENVFNKRVAILFSYVYIP